MIGVIPVIEGMRKMISNGKEVTGKNKKKVPDVFDIERVEEESTYTIQH